MDGKYYLDSDATREHGNALEQVPSIWPYLPGLSDECQVENMGDLISVIRTVFGQLSSQDQSLRRGVQNAGGKIRAAVGAFELWDTQAGAAAPLVRPGQPW